MIYEYKCPEGKELELVSRLLAKHMIDNKLSHLQFDAIHHDTGGVFNVQCEKLDQQILDAATPN